MRKDCELEIIASPESKCVGTYAGNCGISMINKSPFTKAGGQFLPGRLVIDTNMATFVDQQLKITCYTSSLPTVTTITVSNVCDNTGTTPATDYKIIDPTPTAPDIQYVDVLDQGPNILRTEYVLNAYYSSIPECVI